MRCERDRVDHDYADLEQYVRDRASDFIALMELAVPQTRRDENRNRHPSISGDSSGSQEP